MVISEAIALIKSLSVHNFFVLSSIFLTSDIHGNVTSLCIPKVKHSTGWISVARNL